MCLGLSVVELQVDGGRRTEQPVGFSFHLIIVRRHTDMEPLDELEDRHTHRDINHRSTGIAFMGISILVY